jgi:transketolase
MDRTKNAATEGVRRGAYLADGDDRRPQVLLLATGSEVVLCVEAYGNKTRVVSMPSLELFECRDDHDCREQVLPDLVTARVIGAEGAEHRDILDQDTHSANPLDHFDYAKAMGLVGPKKGWRSLFVTQSAQSATHERPRRS